MSTYEWKNPTSTHRQIKLSNCLTLTQASHYDKLDKYSYSSEQVPIELHVS